MVSWPRILLVAPWAVLVALGLGCPSPPASANEPARADLGSPVHLRGGIWDQLITWIRPGPQAYAAIGRVIDRANLARREAGLPPLLPTARRTLVLSIQEEHDGRGPDGAPLPDMAPNQELFLATMVTIEGSDDTVFFFLTDPIRSSAALTGKGVPGAPGRFERQASRTSAAGSAGTARLDVICTTSQGDRFRLSAAFSVDSAKARNRAPDARAYLDDQVENGNVLVFASAPTTHFVMRDRLQSTFYDLPSPGVEFRLEAHHHDPEIEAIVGDAANVPRQLIELRRVVRIERTHLRGVTR